MSIKQKQLIEYAIQDLVAMLVERRGMAIQEAMQTVYRSRFHAKLQDVETGFARASFQCNTGRFCLEWLAC